MIPIYINNSQYFVKNSVSILEACKLAGLNIKRFCYHEILTVAGNCRMCLVEIENNRKVQASCVTQVSAGIEIYTDTPYVKKLRENVLESLLINHPLDCPICDQGGECDLQDQSKTVGKMTSKFGFLKRQVELKNFGPLIKTVMTRCIQCTRCVRYTNEICGNTQVLGTLGRGVSSEIGLYLNKFLDSEISGNVLDLCPVGALTAKPYAFRYRPWELSAEESVDLLDGLGSSILFNCKQTEIIRVLPKQNSLLNDSLISDKIRFFFDSLTTNRVKKIFSKTKNNEILLKDFTKKIYIFVDEMSSLNQQLFLKKLSFRDSRISVVKLTSSLYTNFHVHQLRLLKIFLDSIQKTCLIISSNLRIENAIINAKIRIKYNNENINFFSIGLKSNLTFPLNLISLNVKEVCKILEGKHIFLSTLVFSEKLSIILGKYTNIRFSNSLEFFLKKINSDINTLTIELYNNSVGSELMHIKPASFRHIKNNGILCLALDDVLNTRLLYAKQNKPQVSFWLNSFGSTISKKSHVIAPLESLYESNGFFINLEGRVQFVKQLIKTESFFKLFFNSVFLKLNSEFSSNYFNYLLELSNNDKLLAPQKFLLNFSKIFFEQAITLNTGVLKSSAEDFYCFDNISKNSKTLATCSQVSRQTNYNF